MSSPRRKPATTPAGTRSPGSWQCPGGNVRVAMSGIRGDERHRGVTTRDAWCRRSVDIVHRVVRSARRQSLGTDRSRHLRRDGRRLSPRGHEVRGRRPAGRVGDDGPVGPLSLLGGPAPPGCVARRSLVLPRSGPLRCREGGSSVRETARLAELRAVPSVGQPGERRDRTPKSVNGFDPAELVVGPGRGLEGCLSPRCRDRVVLPVVVEPGYRALSKTGAQEFERADAVHDRTTSEGGIHGPGSRGEPG